MCINPYVDRGLAYGCGQCMPCRINRRRLWAHRIMLEANEYSDNSFVTLTYSDEYLPGCDEHPGGVLLPKHLQDFFKRFRSSIAPRKVRYYAVGEYGDRSGRAHYHVALFGWPSCLRGQTQYSRRSDRCCAVCDHLRNTWQWGNTYSGQLNAEAAQYIAGYVTKKWTNADNPALAGRPPEFARMSLRPGIGALAMHDVASVLIQHGLVLPRGDVPSTLRYNGRVMPLGRYLRRQLRELVGMEPNAPQSSIDQLCEAMRPLQLAARSNPGGLKAEVLAQSAGKVASLTARAKIFKQRRSI